MTESEFAARKGALMEAWDYPRGPDDQDECPFEPKASDWGWLDGRPVAIDYSAPMLD
jgi:hypothetical protein